MSGGPAQEGQLYLWKKPVILGYFNTQATNFNFTFSNISVSDLYQRAHFPTIKLVTIMSTKSPHQEISEEPQAGRLNNEMFIVQKDDFCQISLWHTGRWNLWRTKAGVEIPADTSLSQIFLSAVLGTKHKQLVFEQTKDGTGHSLELFCFYDVELTLQQIRLMFESQSCIISLTKRGRATSSAWTNNTFWVLLCSDYNEK